MADPASPIPSGSEPAQPPPVLSETEKRYRDAGLARNQAQLKYKTTVKEHGKDSAEAKDAKKALDEAQAKVLEIQKELQPKKVEKTNPKTPTKIPEKKPEPEKAPPSAPEAPKTPLKGTYIMEHVYEERIYRIDRLIDPKKMEQLLKEFRKNLKELERIAPPQNNEMLIRRTLLFKLPDA